MLRTAHKKRPRTRLEHNDKWDSQLSFHILALHTSIEFYEVFGRAGLYLGQEYGHGMKKPACIQEGVYELAYVWSPKFRGYRWMLKDVPFFSGILIHVGNFPKDTLGCILVGDEKCSHSIGVSKKADERLRRSMNRIKETGCKQYIRITNEFV